MKFNTKELLKEAENYFPPEYSYKEISRFRGILDLALKPLKTLFNEEIFNQEQRNFILKKISIWCAKTYIYAYPLNLNDTYCEKLLTLISTTIGQSFLNCLKKNKELKDIDYILDEIAKENFLNTLNMYLSRGIINKQQSTEAQISIQRINFANNQEVNVKNNKNFQTLTIVFVTIFGLLPILIATLFNLNIIETVLTSLVLAAICYWVYMLIQNWRINKELKELWSLKAAEYGGGTDFSNKKGSAETKPYSPAINDNGAKSATNNRIVQTSIEIHIGKNLEPFAEGYFDGQLPVLIARLRNKLIKDLNYSLPPIATIPNNLLDADVYVIKIKKQEVGSGKVSITSPSKYEFPLEIITVHLENCIKQNLSELK